MRKNLDSTDWNKKTHDVILLLIQQLNDLQDNDMITSRIFRTFFWARPVKFSSAWNPVIMGGFRAPEVRLFTLVSGN